jgi:L-threonylcarbamoyladenylate synthase
VDIDAAIQEAVAALRAGELVGMPTETVYGLAADATNADAVREIFRVKGRPSSHPLIVHIGSADDLDVWARDVPPVARALAERFWPGPLTMVLPRAAHVLPEVTGGQDTVALRVPGHPVARALIDAFGGGLAAPSANRYGRISPTTADAVREELGDAVRIVLDGGPSQVGLESTIVACLNGQVTVLRPGHITRDEIARVAGTVAPAATSRAPRVPGSTRSHYAPLTPLLMVTPDELSPTVRRLVADGYRVAVLALRPPPRGLRASLWVQATPDAEAYARDLYARLRMLDQAGADRLLVERPPDGPLWVAIHDRLRRASAAAADDDAPPDSPERDAP